MAEGYTFSLRVGNASWTSASRNEFLYGNNATSFGFLSDLNLGYGLLNIYANTAYAKCEWDGSTINAIYTHRGGDNVIGSDGINSMGISRTIHTLQKKRRSKWFITSTDVVAQTFIAQDISTTP